MRRLLLVGAFSVLAWAQQEAEHGQRLQAGKEGDPAGQAHAEETQNPNEIYWKWANFAILAGALGYLGTKYAGPFFAVRSEEIRRGIADSGRQKADAEARAAEMERRLANLEQEIADLRHGARDEMAAEAERLDRETEAMVAKIRLQAEHDIASQAALARQHLKNYSASLALELAEAEIKRRLTPESQGELVQRFGERLPGMAKAQGA